MKKLTEIRNEKATYFVCINGDIPFESDTLTECKQYLINYIKENKKDMIQENELYNYYIGMYNIDIMD